MSYQAPEPPKHIGDLPDASRAALLDEANAVATFKPSLTKLAQDLVIAARSQEAPVAIILLNPDEAEQSGIFTNMQPDIVKQFIADATAGMNPESRVDFA